MSKLSQCKPTRRSKASSKNSAVFVEFFDRLMKSEGGYVNHRRDPGGETNWGVTKRVARKYGYLGSMRKLPKSVARDIAYKKYWKKVGADRFADKKALAWQLFDASYNHGSSNAVRFLQRAVGVVDDGIIGTVTMEAVNALPVSAVVIAFNNERLSFYTRLSTFKTFGKGWSRRIADNLAYAVADLRTTNPTDSIDRGDINE